MTELGKIGHLAAGATGKPAKAGKAAEKQKTANAQKETEQLSTVIKNYAEAKKAAKMLDKLDGKEDGVIDMGKIAGALTGKSATSLKSITVDDYVKGQLFPPKSSIEKK